jgi:hypothetical protein
MWCKLAISHTSVLKDV